MDIFPNFPTLFPQFRETAGFNVGSPLPTFLHGLRSVKSLQTMKWSEVKSLSRVRLFVTPWTFQGIVLEWIAISFSRGSSWSRDWTRVSHIVDRRLTVWATREVHHEKCWVGCITSWNQNCHEKYQQLQISKWYYSDGRKWRGTK